MKNTILFILFALFSFHTKGQSIDHNGFSPLINGTKFKITQAKNIGTTPQKGDIIKISLFKYDDKGNLIFSTEMLNAPNGVEMNLSETHIPGDIMDVFLQMKPGERAEAIVPIWIADNDTTLKSQPSKYRYTVELHGFKTQEENKKQQEKLLVQLRIQQKLLFDSISNSLSNDYKDFIQKNDAVKVHYILKLLPEMQELDNSYLRGTPFEFKVGNQQVIQGWDIALQKLKPGIKVILLVPSWLAYGFHGTGREIGPNAPLYFEIEIIE